jgi:hypothetical protein
MALIRAFWTLTVRNWINPNESGTGTGDQSNLTFMKYIALKPEALRTGAKIEIFGIEYRKTAWPV